MLYYNWILNIDDKKLHGNTAEASEYIICKHSATGCYDTILLNTGRQAVKICGGLCPTASLGTGGVTSWGSAIPY
jgi:hypothetical protein